jgi:hypothetical protein
VKSFTLFSILFLFSLGSFANSNEKIQIEVDLTSAATTFPSLGPQTAPVVFLEKGYFESSEVAEAILNLLLNTKDPVLKLSEEGILRALSVQTSSFGFFDGNFSPDENWANFNKTVSTNEFIMVFNISNVRVLNKLKRSIVVSSGENGDTGFTCTSGYTIGFDVELDSIKSKSKEFDFSRLKGWRFSLAEPISITKSHAFFRGTNTVNNIQFKLFKDKCSNTPDEDLII